MRALFSMGKEMLQQGNPAEALRFFTAALEKVPGEPELLLHAGVALYELKRNADAVACYRQVIEQQPANGIAFNNLGNALLVLGDFSGAEVAYREAAQLLPLSPVPLAALATTRQMQGDVRGAEECCRLALLKDPDFAEAHWNLALALLIQGKMPEGWDEFEWRWRKADFSSLRRQFQVPLWDGRPLRERPLLLHAEQGFGDTIQFVRYVPQVLQRVAEVVIECHPALVQLFEVIPGVKQVLPFLGPLPDVACHAPLMSLPRILRTTLETIPSGEAAPYLVAPRDRCHVWREHLQGVPGPKIGLAWAGNPIHHNDVYRTLPLEFLAPLLEGDDATFYSLQKGAGCAELAASRLATRVVDLTDRLVDFADTAALIEQLDLVISVDTAVGHLAGALGRPVWLLLPFAPDWRWLLGREDSPWYPTMRLFRQSKPGDWGGVIHNVVGALARKIGMLDKEVEND